MADEDELDRLFAAARQQDAPSADLSARVLAAGIALQPKARGEAGIPSGRTVPSRGIWAEIAEALGGWRTTGGLTAAVMLGFWLGVSDPSGLLGAASAADSLELMPGADDLIAGLVDEG